MRQQNSVSSAPPANSPAAPAAAKQSGGFLAGDGQQHAGTAGTRSGGISRLCGTVKTRARAQGINEQTLNSAFANIHFVDRVIKSDRNQPEQKITLDDYLARVLTEKNGAGPQLLSGTSKRADGSQPAVWRAAAIYRRPVGMESNFGQLQGREDIISALATLAFEGRRETFFTNELIAALKMIQQGHISAQEMKGLAGAMGQNQFMPSSYLRYGADGDGDGKIDIWRNSRDVFASTANYLAKEGWRADEGWGGSGAAG